MGKWNGKALVSKKHGVEHVITRSGWLKGILHSPSWRSEVFPGWSILGILKNGLGFQPSNLYQSLSHFTKVLAPSMVHFSVSRPSFNGESCHARLARRKRDLGGAWIVGSFWAKKMGLSMEPLCIVSLNESRWSGFCGPRARLSVTTQPQFGSQRLTRHITSFSTAHGLYLDIPSKFINSFNHQTSLGFSTYFSSNIQGYIQGYMPCKSHISLVPNPSPVPSVVTTPRVHGLQPLLPGLFEIFVAPGVAVHQ